MSTTILSPPVLPFSQGRIVPIDLSGSKGPSSYDIIIGDSILSESGTLISMRLGKRRCVIITDSHVAPLYQQRLEAMLHVAGHTLMPTIMIAAGESSKNVSTLEYLLNTLMNQGIDRKSLVIALGGGVVGDCAGLAAALALRGLDYVQIPTTLLAQVDSSVGGKTGIDTAYGKNVIGAFYHPRLVITDVSLLDSLPARDMRSGYAEVVKYGFINDLSFFQWCQTHGGKLLSGDREAQIHAISTSCSHKARIVAADEREAGERALLNLGHTFGHALEAATGYSDQLLHGEAVALGIILAFKLSAQLGLCSHTDAYDVRDHLANAGLPVKPPSFDYDVDQLMTLMSQDKKAQAGKLTLILARGIGQAFISRDVQEQAVRDLWQEFLSPASP